MNEKFKEQVDSAAAMIGAVSRTYPNFAKKLRKIIRKQKLKNAQRKAFTGEQK